MALMENQKYCVDCGSEIRWDEIQGPSFHDPVHGQPRFYVRGECPMRVDGQAARPEDHSFGLISEPGQFGLFPLPYGIMSDHPAIKVFLEQERDEPSGAL